MIEEQLRRHTYEAIGSQNLCCRGRVGSMRHRACERDPVLIVFCVWPDQDISVMDTACVEQTATSIDT